MDSITQNDVIRIIELVEKTNTDELQLEMGDLKLTIRKGVAARTVISKPAANTDSAVAARDDSSPSKRTKQRHERADVSASAQDAAGALAIKAPMLGTFYKAPKPGAPPFVEVGQVVVEDDTVCIIEVMKLFTTIKAGVQGRIVKALADDGQMVEFDQPLFLVEAVAGEAVLEESKVS